MGFQLITSGQTPLPEIAAFIDTDELILYSPNGVSVEFKSLTFDDSNLGKIAIILGSPTLAVKNAT